MKAEAQLAIATGRYVDHIGMTVPNMDEAIGWLTQALGAQLLWRVGPFHETPTGVHIESVEIAMMRLGPNANLELLCYESEDQRRHMPVNIDVGSGHIAFFVDDLQAAAASLKRHGARMFPGPLEGAGEEKKGERIHYFQTPWGAYMEILYRPAHLGYEKNTPHRLFTSEDRWPAGIPSERSIDHFGLVVPDLGAATDFFVNALGADLLWTLGPFPKTPTGVPIRNVWLAMLRLGPNLNLELQQIEAEQQVKAVPSNIDWGAMHLGFFVDDLEAALESLKPYGVEPLAGPIATEGAPKKGENIWYFKTPWGALLELVHRPSSLPYEDETSARLYRTA